jgi:medium-chain acyl-[acyl-carrier-protein] hydrolase
VLKLFLPALRADFTMFNACTPTAGEPLDGPLSAFGGEQDEEVAVEDLPAWERLTQGRFRLRLFPGGHFFHRTQQKQVLDAIVADLAGWLGK